MRKVALVGALFAAGVALVPLASGGTAGTFALRVELPWQGTPAACAGSQSPTVRCYAHPGGYRAVPGLGVVSQHFIYPVETNPGPTCPDGFQVLPSSARLIVSRRGGISLAVDAADGCLHGPPSDTVLSPTQAFTITGGTGVFTGASGTGVVRRPQVYRTSTGHGGGVDLWEGALVVPNLELDLTPPAIAGAVSRVVRAPRGVARVRVRYQLGASDAVDGAVSVTCRPRSGSLFKVDRRTLVRCSAMDLSANTASASFTVTVKRH
jgi:HYR domain